MSCSRSSPVPEFLVRGWFFTLWWFRDPGFFHPMSHYPPDPPKSSLSSQQEGKYSREAHVLLNHFDQMRHTTFPLTFPCWKRVTGLPIKKDGGAGTCGPWLGSYLPTTFYHRKRSRNLVTTTIFFVNTHFLICVFRTSPQLSSLLGFLWWICFLLTWHKASFVNFLRD